MKSFVTLSGLLLAAGVAGCATTPEPAPPLDHPANPRAAAAQPPERSATLAVDAAPATLPADAPAGHVGHADHSAHDGHEGHGK